MEPAASLRSSRPGDGGRDDVDRFRGAIRSCCNCADSSRPGRGYTFAAAYSSSWYAESKSGFACCYRDYGFPQHGLLWGRGFSPADADFNPWSEYADRWCSTYCCYLDLGCRVMVAGKTGSPARTPSTCNGWSALDCLWSRG